MCKYCNRFFYSPSGFYNHVRTVHLCIRLQCPVCKKIYTQKHAALKHMTKEHGHILQTHTYLTPIEIQMDSSVLNINHPPNDTLNHTIQNTSSITPIPSLDNQFITDYGNFLKNQNSKCNVDRQFRPY